MTVKAAGHFCLRYKREILMVVCGPCDWSVGCRAGCTLDRTSIHRDDKATQSVTYYRWAHPSSTTRLEDKVTTETTLIQSQDSNAQCSAINMSNHFLHNLFSSDITSTANYPVLHGLSPATIKTTVFFFFLNITDFRSDLETLVKLP